MPDRRVGVLVVDCGPDDETRPADRLPITHRNIDMLACRQDMRLW
jgi:hypothetical protein